MVLLELQLECNLWEFTWDKQTISTASPSICKALFSCIYMDIVSEGFWMPIWLFSPGCCLLSIALHLQEMVDFLVDIWEQEGMYDWLARRPVWIILQGFFD